MLTDLSVPYGNVKLDQNVQERIHCFSYSDICDNYVGTLLNMELFKVLDTFLTIKHI